MSRTDEHNNGVPKANLRTQRKEQTRQRLIESMLRCVEEHGYAATKVDDVANAAGVTRAAFYLHFRGKSDLIHDLLDRHRRMALRSYESLTAAVRSGRRDELSAWLSAALASWEETRWYGLAVSQASAVEEDVREFHLATFRAGVDAIADGLVEAHRWDVASCRLRAVIAFSQLENFYTRWLRTGWDLPRSEVTDVMAEMWATALLSA